MSLQVGAPAPDFTVPDANGHPVTLSDLRGKPVVLFFYPRADTPGCTIEACSFRDSLSQFESSNAEVLGISADDTEPQSKFAKKFQLPYRLLCDTDHSVAEAYQVWVEKTNYGKKYMGIQRSTFVIDPAGNLAAVFPKVSNIENHVAEVLAAVNAIS